MNITQLQAMERADLDRYLEFFLHHYRVVDAFWFLFTAEAFGQQAAEKINERVWDRAAGLAAKDLLAKFPVQERGLQGFLKIYSLFPWSMLIDYDVRQESGALVLSVGHCPPQEARLKRGMGEYDCKAMHAAEFRSIAMELDPRICVECVHAPPAAHPAERFCQWRFTLQRGDAAA
jgi:hypothetical protein